MNCFLLILAIFKCTLSYKVLVFNPAFGASHSNFLGKISDILIDAGHEVTMMIPVFEESRKDLVGSKKVKNIIRLPQDPRVAQLQKEHASEETFRKKTWLMSSNIYSMFSVLETFKIASGLMCESIFQQEELLKNLEHQHFDLAFSESYFICAFALFDRIGVRSVINADSLLFIGEVKKALGEPGSAAYYPDVFSPTGDKMNFFERIANFVLIQSMSRFAVQTGNYQLESIKPIFRAAKTVNEYVSGAAFNFINSNRFIDYASPTLPKTVFVGGMQVSTKKGKLEKQWDDLLDLRNTTILVSFGSMAYSSDMPEAFKKAFLTVFASMPDTTFIWKYEEENATLASHLDNVKLTTWMPQVDLLADDRLSLFVTHGGLGSTMELAYKGKPAVVIPLKTDQPRNAHMLTRHGGAIRLDKTNLDKPEEIRKAIQTVLRDPSYKKNAEKLAKILQDQPYQPKDVVLKHCDFAVEFGALETLNSEGRHLSTFQFYSLDIALAAIVIVIFVTFLVYIVMRTVFRIVKTFFGRFKTKVD